MIVGAVLQACKPLVVGGRLAFEDDRTAIGQDQPVPGQQRPVLSECDIGIIVTDQARALGISNMRPVGLS